MISYVFYVWTVRWNKFSMKWVMRCKYYLLKIFVFQNSGRNRMASLPCYQVVVFAVFCTQILSTAQEHRFQEKWPLAVLVILNAFFNYMCNVCSLYKKLIPNKLKSYSCIFPFKKIITAFFSRYVCMCLKWAHSEVLYYNLFWLNYDMCILTPV